MSFFVILLKNSCPSNLTKRIGLEIPRTRSISECRKSNDIVPSSESWSVFSLSGTVISVEKLIAEQGDEVTFDDVLLVSGEDVKIGKPNVEGAKVVGVVLEQGKEAKIRIFKYKAKSNYRRRQGHRQPFTKVQIKKIK